MFSKIPLLASLLFFLLGTNAFAYSPQKESISNHGTVQTESFHHMTTYAVLNASNNNVTTGDSATETSKGRTEDAVLLNEKDKVIEPTFKDYAVPGSVGLLLIVGFVSYWLIYRRKHV